MGQITFTTHRDGNAEIYVMNADGSAQTNLTNNPAFDSLAVWSPNGNNAWSSTPPRGRNTAIADGNGAEFSDCVEADATSEVTNLGMGQHMFMPPVSIGARRQEAENGSSGFGTLVRFSHPLAETGTVGRIHPAHA